MASRAGASGVLERLAGYLETRGRSHRERLKPRILEIWRDSDGTYGAPRIEAEPRLGDGIRVGRK